MSDHASEIWPDIQIEFTPDFFESDRDFYNAVARDIGRQYLTDAECAAAFNIKRQAQTDAAINGLSHPSSHWPLLEQVAWLRAQSNPPEFAKKHAR